MAQNLAGRKRRRKLVASLLGVFLLAATTIFGFSFLPWFKYLTNSSGPSNPFDLVALEKMDPGKREQLVGKWMEEFKDMSDEEKANRADQYIDAVVNYLDQKLNLEKGQSVQTKSLVKSAVMVANQSGLREEDFPKRDEAFNELREKVRGQLDQILSPVQRDRLRDMMEEREKQAQESQRDRPRRRQR
jgi:hypothetical protein